MPTMSENQESGIMIFKNDSSINKVVKQISYYCEKDKNLMISVFDIKNNNFLYCNDSFKYVLGYNINEIIRGGWEFWYKKIDPAEAGGIRNKINFLIQKPHPGKIPEVISFNYHIKDIFSKWILVSHELSLYHFKKNLIALNYLYDISQKERIEYLFGVKKSIHADKDNDAIAISKREKEVLMLIAEGFSSKQIADELYISNHTAITHRKNLIEKFKVRNTAQLIREASKSILL
jgi:DNA-binding CsgD family transcriptional regulator